MERVSAIPYSSNHSLYDIISGGYPRTFSYVTETGNIAYVDTFIRYFYSKIDNNSQPLTIGSSWDSPTNSGYWASTDELEWLPQMSSDISLEPKKRIIQYGDGYKQEIKEGINSCDVKFSAKFDKISIKKAKALIHFFDYVSNNNDERTLGNYFIMKVPNPFSSEKLLFGVTNYSLSWEAYNVCSVNASFEQINHPAEL